MCIIASYTIILQTLKNGGVEPDRYEFFKATRIKKGTTDVLVNDAAQKAFVSANKTLGTFLFSKIHG